MEAGLTGKPIGALNTEDSAVTEEANYNEAITSVAKAINEMEIDIEEKHNI